jgi:hypothetical protein
VDAFERYVRAGLELAGDDIDETEMRIVRLADGAYGPEMRALEAADLSDVWPEPDLDPGRAPRTS